MHIGVSATIAELNGQNAATHQIRYKAVGDEQWTELSGAGSAYTSDALECAIDTPWSIEATVSDMLGSTTAAATIPVAFTLIDFYRNGAGLSIGGIATGPGLVCHMDANFKGKIEYNGISLVDYFYPVGACIITSSAEFDPNTAYPGTTWERIKDRFILAAGDAYKAGSTGGAAEVTLTVDQMPAHNHKPSIGNETGSSWARYLVYNDSNNGFAWIDADNPNTVTSTVGGDQAHNNMPPYVAKYVWERTA